MGVLVIGYVLTKPASTLSQALDVTTYKSAVAFEEVNFRNYAKSKGRHWSGKAQHLSVANDGVLQLVRVVFEVNSGLTGVWSVSGEKARVEKKTVSVQGSVVLEDKSKNTRIKGDAMKLFLYPHGQESYHMKGHVVIEKEGRVLQADAVSGRLSGGRLHLKNASIQEE